MPENSRTLVRSQKAWEGRGGWVGGVSARGDGAGCWAWADEASNNEVARSKVRKEEEPLRMLHCSGEPVAETCYGGQPEAAVPSWFVVSHALWVRRLVC